MTRAPAMVVLVATLTFLGAPASTRVALFAAPAASCETLMAVSLPETTIKSASLVMAGAFSPPGGNALTVPAFCRVVATIAPAIQFEVWLPVQGWNGKFQGVGNGGTAGSISYPAMATALRRGYAVTSTDTGHVNQRSFDSTWALGRPDLIADFGYRALHLATVHGKTLTHVFYDRAPDHAYYVGCSKGGQQGLMEAQRFPDDYDGLIAGDPANNWTRFYAGGHLWYSLATTKDPESYIPAAKIQLLGDAVNEACDAVDGVRDGVLNDPRTCKFDPAVLLCKAGQPDATCFSAKQVKAVADIWAGAQTSAGELIYPGLVPGGEAGSGGWSSWTTGGAPFTAQHWLAADGFFKYMVFDNPDWDFRSFNYDTDVTRALDKVGASLDATDPDLRPLKQRGAKLIAYHGWSDPDISPINSINYYESVVKTVGAGQSRAEALRTTQEFFRLFMVPGLQHCTGGPGATTFDMLTALEAWVEQGQAPAQVIASRQISGTDSRTRPLCPYPQQAVYRGTGSTEEAASFTCRAP